MTCISDPDAEEKAVRDCLLDTGMDEDDINDLLNDEAEEDDEEDRFWFQDFECIDACIDNSKLDDELFKNCLSDECDMTDE